GGGGGGSEVGSGSGSGLGSGVGEGVGEAGAVLGAAPNATIDGGSGTSAGGEVSAVRLIATPLPSMSAREARMPTKVARPGRPARPPGQRAGVARCRPRGSSEPDERTGTAMRVDKPTTRAKLSST